MHDLTPGCSSTATRSRRGSFGICWSGMSKPGGLASLKWLREPEEQQQPKGHIWKTDT
jgi:hypothetical protein